MQKWTRFEPFVFYTILLLFLVPIWSVDFFVTGDGPCHLYNSKVLKDLFTGVQPDFYQPFYYINKSFEPNWLFNLLTIPLIDPLGIKLTEKIFFTFYVLLFGLGFRFLINEINPASRFLSSVGLLFCYHKLLMMGFLNNSLSFALWFWVAALWWRYRNNFHPGWLIGLGIAILTLYSAHPMGLLFGLMMIGCLAVGLFYYESKTIGLKESKALFFKRAAGLFVATLPSLVLLIEFLLKHTWTKGATGSIGGTFNNIATLSSLVTMNSTERDLAKATSILCLIIFIGAIVLRFKQRKLLPTDGLLLFIAFVLYYIINPSNSMSGGLEVSLRMAMVPFVALLCWSATSTYPLWSQLTIQLCALILAIGFINARLPIHRNASDYASEIYSCRTHLQDTSTLMVLNYDWAGQTIDGQIIANRIWLFPHVDCYLGADKSMVISDNYEANYSYFPTQARWETKFYTQTDKDGINFDHRPPRADLLSYRRRTGQQIDYVLMIGYRKEFEGHPYTREIFDQLSQAYDLAYTSAHARAILYKIKPAVQ